jgi:exopolysaccharide biosynthesis polyprenyl glycosylphosphotransferase
MSAPAQQQPERAPGEPETVPTRQAAKRTAPVIEFPAIRYTFQPAAKDPAARFERLVTVLEIAADLLTVSLAVAIGDVINAVRVGASISPSRVIGAGLAIATIMVMMLEHDDAYSPGSSLLRVRETERVLRAWFQTLVLLCAIALFARVEVSRFALVFAVFGAPLLLVAEKNLLYTWLCDLHACGYGVRNAVIYGAGLTGRRLFSALARSPKLGVRPVALVDDNPSRPAVTVYETSNQRRRSIRVLHGPVTSDMLRRSNSKVLVIGIPSITREKLAEVASAAAEAECLLCMAPYDFAPGLSSLERADVDGTLLVMFKPGSSRSYELLKRLVDVVGSSILLLVLLPLFLTLAVGIRLTSAGPAFFRQERVGKDGARFRMYKFRTMHVAASPYAYSPTTVDDPRITRIGRFLRRSSLDELPQLINVLKGEMSLVGPRPEMPFIVAQYNTTHRERLKVKPGITGLWQLSADRAYHIHENIEYDLYYIRHRTFFMDIAVLLHTVIFAARGI